MLFRSLTIPQEVVRVWTDDGWGHLQDNGGVTSGQGAYYHVALENWTSNQLTEMVPVDRVESEVGRYIKAGATQYLLVNTSDLRPVVMTTKAVMDVGWRGLHTTADEFYREWSMEEFGEAAAPAIAEIYRDYFAAPAQRPVSGLQLEYGDEYYHTTARWLLLSYMNGPLV